MSTILPFLNISFPHGVHQFFQNFHWGHRRNGGLNSAGFASTQSKVVKKVSQGHKTSSDSTYFRQQKKRNVVGFEHTHSEKHDDTSKTSQIVTVFHSL